MIIRSKFKIVILLLCVGIIFLAALIFKQQRLNISKKVLPIPYRNVLTDLIVLNDVCNETKNGKGRTGVTVLNDVCNETKNDKRQTDVIDLNDVCNETKTGSRRNDVIAFNNVCIEIENGIKRIVVYNRCKQGSVRINVGGGPNQQKKFWNIYFKKSHVPIGHHILKEHAYFVKYTCEGNLHHFWIDTFDGLYGAMKQNKDIVNGTIVTNSYVLSNEGVESNGDTGCHSLTRYEPFIWAMGAVYHNSFQALPENTCFKTGVFGYTKRGVDKPEQENFLLKQMNITDEKCKSISAKPLVLIQDRYSRRITNTAQLKTDIEKRLPVNVKVTDFGQISLPEQVQLVVCARVLIGVHGAGMEHLRFLRPGASVIEVGWRHWPTDVFTRLAKSYGHTAQSLGDCNATISPHAWQTYRKTNPNIGMNDTQVLKLANKVPSWSSKNVWKYADCNISTTNVILRLQKLLSLNLNVETT